MTGAGAPGGPGIIKALNKLDFVDLFIADADENASGRFLLLDKFVKIPSANEENFCYEILKICIERNIEVIFPLVTRELFKLSQNIQLFSDHNIRVIVSDYESLQTANDKCRLYEHLARRQIELPKYRVVNSYSEYLDAITYIGYPQKPFCIKPGISNGSRGIRIVDETIDRFSLLFDYKPNSIYMGFDELGIILQQRQFPELLVSEVLPGDEITIDTVVDKNNVKLILPRKRLKMNAGISVAGEFFYDREVISYTQRILKTLELSGPIGIQMKKNSEGHYRILEINPRIQGTSVAAMGLDINLPELVVRNALQMDNKYPGVDEIRWGTKFFRYYDEIFF
jgi:carbamoyl-phosphate synthase large subunit